MSMRGRRPSRRYRIEGCRIADVKADWPGWSEELPGLKLQVGRCANRETGMAGMSPGASDVAFRAILAVLQLDAEPQTPVTRT